MKKQEKFKNVMIAGIVGDMLGASHKSTIPDLENTCYPFGKVEKEDVFYISDDSQFTLATCQVISENRTINGELLAEKFKDWFKKGKFSGLGSSTLKALKDLEVGIHWSISGHKSERAAGNGIAMRIAPIAFFPEFMNKTIIQELSVVTHRNDEAYTGGLAIAKAIELALIEIKGEPFWDQIINISPDTLTKEQLIKASQLFCSIFEAGQVLGSSGYVIESVPFSIYAALKGLEIGFEEMFNQIISCGGVTDTNAAMAGQILAAFGVEIPSKYITLGKTDKAKCFVLRFNLLQKNTF